MRKRTKLFIILLLVLTAAVIVYALFFMGRSTETPGVSLPDPDQTGSAQPSADTGYTELTLTPDNVQAAIKELSRAESYSATVTVEDFWAGGSSSQELQVWVDGNRTRVRGAIGGGTRNVLVDGDTLYIWYDSVSGVSTLPADTQTDRWLRSITYEDVLDIPSEQITAAGYRQYNGIQCIYVEYNDGSEDYVDSLYISVSDGLLRGAETYEDGELIYRMSATVSSLVSTDESLFTPPST